ncbi:cuticle protein 16.8 [Trichonephila clavata]|uniref:Cuticle protein 16.8 n=1 Tax=Trichonephila clavata TaxID=2740835 RepID=A0A8X6L1S0_TRICU|nr:cuticle protein 16.8 [Trichonephila clavata]
MFPAFSMKFFGFCMITILLKLVQSQRVLEPIPVVQPPKPYNYGFQFGDGLGMSQFRQESADGTGEVKGSYGYIDPYGATRNVEYNAGADGYRAVIKSNEPGLANHAPADAVYVVQPPPPAVVAQGLRKPVPIVPVLLK